jgi:hypothetical protein
MNNGFWRNHPCIYELSYDAENRLVQVSWVAVVGGGGYDRDGQRVMASKQMDNSGLTLSNLINYTISG